MTEEEIEEKAEWKYKALKLLETKLGAENFMMGNHKWTSIWILSNLKWINDLFKELE